MRKITRWFLFVLLVFALFVAVTPLFAQEATVVPTAPVVVTAPPSDGGTVAVPSWLVLALPLFLAAMTPITLIIYAIIHNRSLKAALEQVDKAQKDAIEAAYEALPETAKDAFSRALNLADKVTDELVAGLKFAREVTDGQPNEDDAAPPSGMAAK